MQDMLRILTRAVNEWQPEDRPVSRPVPAPELKQLIDISLQHEATDLAALEQAVKDYLHYSPAVYKSDFNKLLYSGQNEPALLGDWITAMANSTMHTYQMSPVATLMELELIKQWNKLIGFSDHPSGGDGIMVSGGTQANLLSFMLARHKACPDYKAKGAQGRTLVAYVSDQAHYSAEKAVSVLGLGTDNLIKVASDENGKMRPDALQSAINDTLVAGHTPFYVGLTAGTTVAGAFDPVKACHTIAKANNLWLHIDGAWGAPVLYSEHHKDLLADSHLADSFTWDAHKLMNVPITAAAILVKEAGFLKQACTGGGGDYLFHADQNASYNLGERSIQCGRRADALKVWLSWKAVGNKGFADKIDHLQSLKTHCVNAVEQASDMTILAPSVYLNVLFQYKPEGMDDEQQLRQLNIAICKALQANGGTFTDYAQYQGRTGIRLIIANEAITTQQLDQLLDEISCLGKEIAATQNL